MKSLKSVEMDYAEIYRTVLSEASGEVFVVFPSADAVEKLVDVLDELADPPTVRLLAVEATLKTVMEDFIVASTTADLIADETLSLRTTESTGMNSLIVTDETVVTLVAAGELIAGLGTVEDEFVASAREKHTAAFEEAEPFSLRTPPISRVHETLAETFDDEVDADFGRVLESLDAARGNGDGLDEVTISLLVAAKHELQLYDISRWGEDTGVASKATFSRTKTRLEDKGVIDTTKVPIDVGRPRLRLLLGNERLQEADIDELAGIAQELLATDD
ncbi:transcriptional regulator TbsP [Halococcus saccharolyticus]|uniref:Transcriptional regulator n=1 Tax=Halococcus saccharolyticus DSM 5350 TaxID=1227455 RepID=M0MKS1_9EURY|nr:DUF5821 family protein [Halococcus saccharolyticus]EMA45010.1 hypothetical protein C449_10144 [Halococcus saccharolyticus DSM 5350]